ncbi:CerR family C-terminal domain-containing protein [Glaciecola siphonariae]|uniref:CerR family C-terminal domain-containing protein n=1 Tax=Glaciecola siphonariae TaxID=521012 RepID=A0ABV9LSS5_9ALTE
MIASRQIDDDIRNSPTAIALIEAGIDQFGLYGQKATTRNVVEQAKANIAAIPYYFRNKNGLYRACMHYIVDEIWVELGKQLSSSHLLIEALDEALLCDAAVDSNKPAIDSNAADSTANESPVAGLSVSGSSASGSSVNETAQSGQDNNTLKEQSLQAYLNIMDTFCVFFLKDPDTQRWAQFIMREHATPTEAYEIFYERYYRHAQRIKVKLLACILGGSEDDDGIKILSHALFGQVLGFLIARESLLRGLGVKDLSGEAVQLIRDVVKQNVLASVNMHR